MAKWYLNRYGLWLPYNPQKPPQSDSRGPLDFIGVTLSYRQVYGAKPTWSDLEIALAPYSLEQIVIVASRISVSLYKSKLPWHPQTQSCICKGMFGPEESPRIFEAINKFKTEMEREGNIAPILVFHEQQTLNLLKAALLLKAEEDNETSDRLVGIGKALLMITDLTEGEPGNLLNVKIGDPDYFDRWFGHILGNYLCSSASVSSSELARSYDLYLTDKPSLRSRGSYVDLLAILRETTGLEPDALWSLTFALGSYWTGLSPESIPDANMAIGRESCLSQFSFTDEEVGRFFAFCATSVQGLRTSVCNLYSVKSLRPFDMLPFAKWPLVAFEDRVYAVSVPALMQKLTTGLHYLYLDGRIEERHRQRYLTYMGEVFEDYVHRAFERMFPPISSRYLRIDDVWKDIATKHCDGLIAYEKGVVLVETKASLFALEARVGHDITSIRGRLSDIYLDGAKQLQASIDRLRQGFRDVKGTIPDDIEWYLPVIVTLEHISMNPVICGEVRRMLSSEGLLVQQDVLQLQSINVGEIEQIEAVLEAGNSLRELFEDKLSAEAEAEDSWANYLFRRWDKLKADSNAFLDKYAKELNERALQYFA